MTPSDVRFSQIAISFLFFHGLSDISNGNKEEIGGVGGRPTPPTHTHSAVQCLPNSIKFSQISRLMKSRVLHCKGNEWNSAAEKWKFASIQPDLTWRKRWVCGQGEEETFQFLVSIEKIRDLVRVREKNAHILTVRGMLPVRSFCVDVQLYGRGRRLFKLRCSAAIVVA